MFGTWYVVIEHADLECSLELSVLMQHHCVCLQCLYVTVQCKLTSEAFLPST